MPSVAECEQDEYGHVAELAPCPWDCGGEPSVTVTGYRGYQVACECYDGAPDSETRFDFADGATKAEATAVWNEMAEDAI